MTKAPESQNLSSNAEDSKKEQEEIHPESEVGQAQGPNRYSKPAKSKREIMEEMTRQRFPWDE